MFQSIIFFFSCLIHLYLCGKRGVFVHHPVHSGSKMRYLRRIILACLANSSYLSCQEINHALASPRREGQASLHVWESKLATFVLPRMKKVGVGDWQTASDVGAVSVKVGVRSTQSLQMTR